MAAKGFRGLIDFLVGQGMDKDTAAKVVSRELSPELSQQRMLEQNYTPDWYHGSTHDVTGFRGDVTNPESDWGQATYFSNTPEDVEANYASEVGPDLTSRISLLAERIADDAYENGNKALQKQIAEIAGKKFGSVTYDERLEAAKVIAGKKLKGDTEGITYPSALDLEQFAHVGGQTPTWLDELDKTDYEALARKDLDRKDYDTPEDFEEAVSEEAFNLKLENQDSPENEFIEVMQKYGVDTSSMPYIDFTETNTIEDLRDLINGFEFYDANDNIVGSGAVIADWLKQRGFKGILDHNVNKRFGSERKDGVPMMGMDYDTTHAIVFPDREEVIRSQYGAAFDESKKGQKGILNQLAPIAVPTAAASTLGATMFKPSEALANPDAPTKANAASLYNPYRAAKIEAEQLRAKQRDPLGFDLTDVKRDQNAGTDILGAIGAGIERSIHSLPHLLTPEGTAQFVGGALGAPRAFELMDKQIQQKAPDYQPEGEMTDKERTLWQLLGEMASPY
jgi:hypothetical protein